MTSRRRALDALWMTLAFGVAYTQLPLYTSNQHHHFLAGLARAGFGWLQDDWQSRTADPFPVFSGIVWFTYRYLGEWWFYVWYQILIAAYIWCLLELIGDVTPACRTSRARLIVLLILTALHSEVLGFLLGFDARHIYWWQMFSWGVAEQEIFGHAMFQGSAFGLLLPCSILLFVRHRPWSATAVAGGIVMLHPSYALTAAALVLGYVLQSARQGRGPAHLAGLAAVFGALVGPVVVDALWRFGPTTPDAWTRATSILVQHLPMETMPARWFGPKATLQIALIVGGLWRVRRTPLLLVLLPAFLTGVVLTAIQIWTADAGLALAFPWRVSALLVPMATAMLVGHAVGRMLDRPPLVAWSERRAATWLAVAAIGGLVLGGVVKMTLHFSYFYGLTPVTGIADRFLRAETLRQFSHDLRPDALGMLRFVRESKQRGDTYLIPLDLERFRLDTGAPAFVDLKSHPYRDVEVLMWRQRIDLARRIQGSMRDCAALDGLGRAGLVTHVVSFPNDAVTSCPGLEVVFADTSFAVLRLEQATRR